MAKDEDFAAPELYGWTLSTVATLAEWIPWLSSKIAQDALFFELRNLNNLTEEPTTVPIPAEYNFRNAVQEAQEPLNIPYKGPSVPFISSLTYQEAYRSKKTTPSEVAERLIKALNKARDYHWIRTFNEASIRQQAEASTLRWKNSQPFGPLDGVFVSIKEELAIKGFETKLGSAFINDGCPEIQDSTVVKRLREAGAIIVGHAVMNEIGWDIFTVNPVTGTAKNPYKLECSCGGSSGGSGGSVASGLVPISIGADSGGSIRIPSSFCGVYGLKPTYGRISTFGSYPIAPSLDVFGPLAATPDDLALAYQAIAGPDPNCPPSLCQPMPSLKDYDKTDRLEGINIAIVPDWNAKTVEPDILSQLQFFAKHFEKLGANIIELQTPPLDMDLVKRAHIVTICAEMNNYACTFSPSQQGQFLPHTRLMMAISRHITGSDYLRAQQIRTAAMKKLCELFKGGTSNNKIDMILMPTTAIQTPEIPEKALSHGLSNTTLTTHTMSFVTLASFTGIPALSFPAGFIQDRPIGLQLVAEWWNEALLLRMAKVCESVPGVERKTPSGEHWFGRDIL